MSTETPAPDQVVNASQDSARKARGPAVPTINLQKAIQLMRKVWEEEKRNPAPVSSILTHWEYKPKSSGGLQAIASLKRFGLLEEQGSGDQRTLKLSQLALDILKFETVDPTEFAGQLKAAALHPKFHSYLWKKYGVEMPSEKTLEAHFIFDLHFPEDTAKAFIKEYKETIAFAKLEASDTVEEPDSELFDPDTPSNGNDNAPPVLPRVQVPPLAATGGGLRAAPTPPLPPQKPAPPVLNPDIKYFVIPTDIGDAHIPMGMSEEDFDLFGNALQLFKKKIVRSAFPKRALWQNKDHDKEVVILGFMGAQDGRCYWRSEEGTGIPDDELTWL